MNVFGLLNKILSVFMAVIFFGNVVYPVLALLFRKRCQRFGSFKKRRYAVMICARNEETVIADLIESVKNQNYPSELVDIFVLADNCTDETATIAAEMGVTTFVRNDKKRVGKGYALNYLYVKIILTRGDIYDGFFVFDADNLLNSDFISAMNSMFDGGNSVLTGIRNTKNYGDSWISAGYSLGWLFQTGLLNPGRNVLGIPCFVNGTGFLIGADVLRKSGGWNWFTLTEDCEFTTYCALNGIKISVCLSAEFYDEQPVGFKVSWVQRLRWMKGKYQICGKYAKNVIKGLFSRRFLICLDSFSNIFPTSLLVFLSAILVVLEQIVFASDLTSFLISISLILVKWYFSILLIGMVTLFVWWKHLESAPLKRILLALCYPIHIAMYVPITLVAAFKSVEWTPIKHGVKK